MKHLISLLAFSFLIGCDGEKNYESPTAVYEAAQEASKERDMEELMNCLTEDSQKDIVNQVIGMLVFLGLGDLPDKDLPKPIAKMQKAMKKHGLSQTVLKELEEGTDYPIKDKAQFVGDFFNSMDIPKSKNLPAIWTDFLEPKGTLENLSIDGDTASASVVREGSKATIIFTKFGESWLIDRHKAQLLFFEQLGKKPDYPESWPDLSANSDIWKTNPLSQEEVEQIEKFLESASQMDSFNNMQKLLISRIPYAYDDAFESDTFPPLLLNGNPYTGLTKSGPKFTRFEEGKQTFQVAFDSSTQEGRKRAQSWDPYAQSFLKKYETDHPKRGTSMKWGKDGKLVEQILYRDGKQIGLNFDIYPNGQRKSEVFFNEQGKKQGADTKWHQNGQKKSVYIYKNGVKNGPYSNWHNNGQLYSQSEYQNGKRHGEYKRWHSNGQQWAIRIHENGKTISAKWWNSRGKEVENEAQSRKE
ncbi:toxin-antitoxin system YwqK family antitoxin [Akkermansiaceae bacterium]|nr:toxin-antitoxin system YwqK family antitoxin [Akkermansiaceae bacterium]